MLTLEWMPSEMSKLRSSRISRGVCTVLGRFTTSLLNNAYALVEPNVRTMQSPMRSSALFIAFVGQAGKPFGHFGPRVWPGIDYQSTKRACGQRLYLSTLRSRRRMSDENVRQCAQQVVLWRHEDDLPRVTFDKCVRWMNKESRNHFLSSVRSRETLLRAAGGEPA